jgi:periplasmic divalent cation tolerance protein
VKRANSALVRGRRHRNMKIARDAKARIVLVTCGSRQEARKIAKAVVGAKLAACVNVVSSPVESVYRWKGSVETAREFLLVMKTTAQRLDALQNEVARLHSYDVPEFLVLGVAGGSAGYLKWLHENCRSEEAR